jgi:hypothetical protein
MLTTPRDVADSVSKDSIGTPSRRHQRVPRAAAEDEVDRLPFIRSIYIYIYIYLYVYNIYYI